MLIISQLMKEPSVATNDDIDQDSMADDWAAAMQEQADADAVIPVELDELKETAKSSHNPDLDVILDIPVSISIEVGRTSITIRNLLQLNQGSVIELDRWAGEP